MERPDQIVAGAWFEDRWIDITRPLSEGIAVWPGDVPFSLDRKLDEGLLVSSFTTTCHVGTHLDAPLHLEQAASA